MTISTGLKLKSARRRGLFSDYQPGQKTSMPYKPPDSAPSENGNSESKNLSTNSLEKSPSDISKTKPFRLNLKAGAGTGISAVAASLLELEAPFF